ncbi:MAG: hypothetical protein AB7V39_10855 [Nitrospiraceae bacterium]
MRLIKLYIVRRFDRALGYSATVQRFDDELAQSRVVQREMLQLIEDHHKATLALSTRFQVELEQQIQVFQVASADLRDALTALGTKIDDQSRHQAEALEEVATNFSARLSDGSQRQTEALDQVIANVDKVLVRFDSVRADNIKRLDARIDVVSAQMGERTEHISKRFDYVDGQITALLSGVESAAHRLGVTESEISVLRANGEIVEETLTDLSRRADTLSAEIGSGVDVAEVEAIRAIIERVVQRFEDLSGAVARRLDGAERDRQTDKVSIEATKNLTEGVSQRLQDLSAAVGARLDANEGSLDTMKVDFDTVKSMGERTARRLDDLSKSFLKRLDSAEQSLTDFESKLNLAVDEIKKIINDAEEISGSHKSDALERAIAALQNELSVEFSQVEEKFEQMRNQIGSVQKNLAVDLKTLRNRTEIMRRFMFASVEPRKQLKI